MNCRRFPSHAGELVTLPIKDRVFAVNWPRILSLEARDVRFPTSRDLDGSDAMNPDPDYSAAYVVLRTDRTRPRGPRPDLHDRPRHRDLRRRRPGARAARRRADASRRSSGDMGGFWRSTHVATASCAGSAPRRASIHLADRRGRQRRLGSVGQGEGKPLWKLLADMTPEQLVACDRLPLHHRRAHARRGARDPARGRRRDEATREREMRATATPPTRPRPAGSATPTTRSRRSSRGASPIGWTHFKMKVGRDLDDDIRRAGLIRARSGPDRKLMMDANQVWDVDEAIAWMRALARVRPLVDRGADEPRRHPRPRPHPRGDRADRRRDRRARARTGSSSSSSSRPSAIDVCQIDACRARRRQRGARRAAAGGEVRHAGLPARRRRRAVRVRPAPRDLRLHRRERLARGPRHRVRRPPARAFPRPCESSATAATGCPTRPATASRCCPNLSTSTSIRTDRPGRLLRWRSRRREVGSPEARQAPLVTRQTTAMRGEVRYRLLGASLYALRAGPALILLLLIIGVSLTTPIFLTSRNVGNVFSQTAVIALLALGQLLVIITSRNRPLGRLDRRPLVGGRRDRLHARPLVGARHPSRSSGPVSPSAQPTGSSTSSDGSHTRSS